MINSLVDFEQLRDGTLLSMQRMGKNKYAVVWSHGHAVLRHMEVEGRRDALHLFDEVAQTIGVPPLRIH